MPHEKVLNQGEKEDLYKKYLLAFKESGTWRDYLELAEKFRSLGTYRDCSDYILKCVNAASPYCYREISGGVESGEIRTVEELRRAAEYMGAISLYKDARELSRNYRAKACALAYSEVIDIVENSMSGVDDWERAVSLLGGMKSYKDSRDLYDRYYGHYVQMRYSEAQEAMNSAGSYSEYMRAALLFEKISDYSDSDKMALRCRKTAGKYKPGKFIQNNFETNEQKLIEKTSAAKKGIRERKNILSVAKTNNQAEPCRNPDQINIIKGMNRKYLVLGFVFLLFSAAGLYGTVVINKANTSLPDFIYSRTEIFRGISVVQAVIFAILSLKSFMKFMTAQVRKKFFEKLVLTARKFFFPVAKAVRKVLLAMGIGTSKGRVRGKDEKSFVYDAAEKSPKRKQSLKNNGKWEELEDNAMRVRFIYTDYMIKKIKGGYFMRHSMTSDEIGKEIADSDDEKLLFEVYKKARYAGRLSLDEIDNRLVYELREAGRQRKNN